MGADDYHVSMEGVEQAFVERTRKLVEEREAERLRKYKQVETLAYKWFDGQITDKRMAEAVFGLINEEGN